MTFHDIASAQQYAREHDKRIVVEMAWIAGVIEIYPGGRTIKWPAALRHHRRLTPDSEFSFTSKEQIK